MRCMKCGKETSVTRTVVQPDGTIVRTRACKDKPREHPTFKTHERPAVPSPPRWVVKRSGDRETFDRGKIRKSIGRALMNPTREVPGSVLDGVLTRVDTAMAEEERDEAHPPQQLKPS